MTAAASIDLSIVSHTNIGKTTLARTLLSRDVGEVADRAHVTLGVEAFTLAETEAGERLLLWDTPGFGNSVALAKRLEGRRNPLGWFLSELWDRATNKTQWLNQKALLHIKETSSVVLYLVNAAQPPAAANYAHAEMRLLQWIDKPVLVLLNQLGEPCPRAEEERQIRLWREAMAPYGIVRDVLAMDAFSRCWVQEFALFDAVEKALAPTRRKLFGRLREAWATRRLEALSNSLAEISDFINERAGDEERSEDVSLLDRFRLLGGSLGLTRRAALRGTAATAAQERLTERANDGFRRLAQRLITVNWLSGEASPGRAFGQLETSWRSVEKLSRAKLGLAGAIGAGAAGGLSADLMTGGLTLGAGALIGALIGAFGAVGAASLYNGRRGATGVVVSWSDEALRGLLREAVLLYLTVAHFGRGRGQWSQSDCPEFWRQTVDRLLAERRDCQGQHLAIAVRPLVEETLRALYPDCRF